MLWGLATMIAHVAGAGAGGDAVDRWLVGTGAPGDQAGARVAELASLVQRLAAVIKTEAVAPWLREPLRVLDDEVALDAIAAGGWQRVSGLVGELESPTFT